MSDRGSWDADQLALATLLDSLLDDRHLRRMRTVTPPAGTALTGAFARHAPGVQLTGLAAGFQAVALLPPGANERAVIAAARERRVGLHRDGTTTCGNPDTRGATRAADGLRQRPRAGHETSPSPPSPRLAQF